MAQALGNILRIIFSDPLVDEFITLCQKIEQPVPIERNTQIALSTSMPHKLTRKFHTITFMPMKYRSHNTLDFGQLPLKNLSSMTKEVQTTLPLSVTKNDSQSILLSIAIILCLAGLLYILIYFTSYNQGSFLLE